MRLRELRAAAGIATQEELAALCGLQQSHISYLESDTIKAPTVTTARKLVAGLNQRLTQPITIEDLFAPKEQTTACPLT
jgi:transcriptional regulator with XRE-family HTH domain